MKKTLLSCLLFVAIQVGAFAQGYTATTTTGTYADLVSPTVISTPGWEPSTASFNVPIGFTFMLDGQAFTSFEADGLGDMYFTSGTVEKAIFPFDGILIDRGFPSTTSTMSPVSYLLTGTAGSRILKLEYKNASTADVVSQTLYPNDFVNFQVWLYEGSNKIEVRYGSSSLTHATDTFFGELGPTVAIVTGSTSADISGHFLQGSTTAPTLVHLTNATSYFGLGGIPANGTIYTFNRVVSGVAKDLNSAAIAVYPNPATDVLHVTGLEASKTPATVKIFDTLGKVVLTGELPATNAVNIKDLAKGTYFMEITSGGNRIGKQVIKL